MAIALSKIKVQAQTGLMLLYSFITLIVVNSLVLIVANALFSDHIVLGTQSISYWWAIYHSMLKFTLIGTFAMPFVAYYEWKNSVTFTPKQWMISYLVLDFVSLWAVTRFAENLGLGISAWYIVLLLAAVFDWAQGMAMMAMGKLVKMS